jgi:hypothetical protein
VIFNVVIGFRVQQVLVYVDCVNVLGGGVRTVKGEGEGLVVFSKEIGLEGNGDRTEYMVMCGEQNVGRS